MTGFVNDTPYDPLLSVLSRDSRTDELKQHDDGCESTSQGLCPASNASRNDHIILQMSYFAVKLPFPFATHS
jgi:hypothetical protein